MTDWFVLFVRTGAEGHIVTLLKELLNADAYMPFIPMKEVPHRENKNILKVKKTCFPGYVFVSSAKGVDDFIRNVVPVALNIREVYCFLCYGEDKKDIVMREHERKGLEALMNSGFCIESSIGYMEGDRIRIVEGALLGKESLITYVDKRQRRVGVEIDIMGDVRKISLMLECIEKIY